MGVGMRSIRAEASHQSVVPRSTVLRFCLEQRAARYRLDLTRSFGECAFISFARYVVNYKMHRRRYPTAANLTPSSGYK